MAIRNFKDYMTDDNERLENLFRIFQSIKGKEPIKARDLLRTFSAGFKRHIVWEEKILFPLIENRLGLGDRGPTLGLREEHREMERILESLQEKAEKNHDIPEEMDKAFMAVLAGHHQTGAETFYPILDNALSEPEKVQTYQKMKEASLKR